MAVERMCKRCGAVAVKPKCQLCDTCRPARYRETRHAKRNAAKRAEIDARPTLMCTKCTVAPRASKDPRCLYCESCYWAAKRERQTARKSEKRQRDADFREKYNAKQREYASEAYRRNPDKEIWRQRLSQDLKPEEKKQAIQRRSLYGLEQAQFEQMLTDQQYACAICQVEFNDTPNVDHCHRTGAVRGLLCMRCNLALGVVEKARERGHLELMLAYLGPLSEVLRAA